MKKLIKNGKIITPDGITEGYLTVIDGVIGEIGEGKAPEGNFDETIDAGGNYVSPGFIDMHTHGAGGADFMDGTVEAYLTAARMHAKHGTTLLFPTTLTSSNEELFGSFDIYNDACRANTDGAQFGGLHLEGPYFSPAFAGAQDARYLRNPEPDDYNAIIERAGGIIRRWSFAPELPGSEAFASRLSELGILASIGHTGAIWEECDRAFKAGAHHLTHFFSCMSTITRKTCFRYGGVIEYGYWQDGMSIEVICDGIHVPAPLLHMIRKIKGDDRIALITDSMRAAGMPEGPSILGGLRDGQEVIVEDGVAKMPDRSAFAGSVATTDRLVRTMVSDGGADLHTAVKMMTANPAAMMGISKTKGSLEKGKDADIVIFDENINVSKTIVQGKVIC